MSILGTDSLALKENVKEKLPPGLTEAEIDARVRSSLLHIFFQRSSLTD
jgi:hypothetical protein